jgi:hypothetical protein
VHFGQDPLLHHGALEQKGLGARSSTDRTLWQGACSQWTNLQDVFKNN